MSIDEMDYLVYILCSVSQLTSTEVLKNRTPSYIDSKWLNLFILSTTKLPLFSPGLKTWTIKDVPISCRFTSFVSPFIHTQIEKIVSRIDLYIHLRRSEIFYDSMISCLPLLFMVLELRECKILPSLYSILRVLTSSLFPVSPSSFQFSFTTGSFGSPLSWLRTWFRP